MTNPTLSAAANPTVAIVMVPRERFSCAREAVESLYASTEFPFRLIYIDANSDAKAAADLRALSNEFGFEIVRTERFLTPSASRNLGARMCSEEYIVFADNDVAYAPGWLEAVVGCAEETGAEVVTPLPCEYEPLHQIIHAAGGQIMELAELERFLAHHRSHPGERPSVEPFRLAERIFKQGEFIADQESPLVRGDVGNVEFHCCLVRRDLFESVGGFDDALSTKEHLDFSLRVLLEGGRLVMEPKARITFFAHAGRRRITAAELRFFLVRWSDRWHAASLRRFLDKWGFADDGYIDAKMLVARTRRKLALRHYIAQAAPALGGFPARVATAALAPFERAWNGALVQKHAANDRHRARSTPRTAP